MDSLRSNLELVTFAALAFLVLVLWFFVMRETRAARDAQLIIANTAAKLDTGHSVRDNAAALILSDAGLAGMQKLVVQVAQQNDALSKAVGANQRALYDVQVELGQVAGKGSGRTTSPAVPVADTSTRTARFDSLRFGRYGLSAAVTIPAHAAPSIFATINSDPIALQLHLECSAKAVNGVRTASVLLTGDSTTALHLGALSQAPEVCSGADAAPRRRWGVGATLGYSGVLASGGRLLFGPGITAGLTYNF